MTNTQDATIALAVEKLKALHPYKIILFGSQAYGNPRGDSDIDLLVVLDSDEMPGSFQENMANASTCAARL